MLPKRSFPGDASCQCQYNDHVPFTIRDFRAADFEMLWRIDQECFPPGISYSRAELKSYIQHRASYTLVAVSVAGSGTNPDDGNKAERAGGIATSHGSIAGFIVAESSPQAGHIITIDVIAAARRFGAGSQLLRSAEDRLRAARCKTVALETAVDNISALSFYKRHGYSVVRNLSSLLLERSGRLGSRKSSGKSSGKAARPRLLASLWEPAQREAPLNTTRGALPLAI